MSFYAYNITVKGPTHADLASYLSSSERRAYVSPSVNGYTIISDELGKDYTELSELAQKIAKEFSCSSLALQNVDDDMLFYQLFTSENLIDQYDSRSSESQIFLRGNAEQLCLAFGQPNSVSIMKAVLHDYKDYESDNKLFPMILATDTTRVFSNNFRQLCRYAGCSEKSIVEVASKSFTSERMRHSALVAALNFPWYALLLQYEDIEDDVWPSDAPELIHTGLS
jgi:hypothetical protein